MKCPILSPVINNFLFLNQWKKEIFQKECAGRECPSQEHCLQSGHATDRATMFATCIIRNSSIFCYISYSVINVFVLHVFLHVNLFTACIVAFIKWILFTCYEKHTKMIELAVIRKTYSPS